MANVTIARQPVTPKGIEKRVDDLELGSVTDPRMAGKVTHLLPPILRLLVLAVTSMAEAMRQVELRARQLRDSVRSYADVPEKIADNTLGAFLQVVSDFELRRVLYRQVKAEHRRGNLAATLLPWNTVAVDGKHLITLRLYDLQRLTRNELRNAEEMRNRESRRQGQPAEFDPRLSDAGWEPSEVEIRAVFATRFPHVQMVSTLPKPDNPEHDLKKPGRKGTQKRHKEAQLYGLIRCHRSTLISAAAAVCLDQRPLAGNTNESGSIVETLKDLLTAYGATNLIEMVTTDAGNTTLAMADELRRQGVHYFLAVKGNQPDIHAEAKRVLGTPVGPPDYSCSEDRSGRTVAYEVFVHSVPAGYLGWTHARTFIRVNRVSRGNKDDDVTEGTRFYVSSGESVDMTGENAYLLSRSHWRCENESHWTTDAIFNEDKRQAPWSRHPNGVLVASIIHLIGLNIVAVFRALAHSRTKTGTLVKPTWNEVIEHFLAELFDTRMDTTAFDA